MYTSYRVWQVSSWRVLDRMWQLVPRTVLSMSTGCRMRHARLSRSMRAAMSMPRGFSPRRKRSVRWVWRNGKILQKLIVDLITKVICLNLITFISRYVGLMSSGTSVEVTVGIPSVSNRILNFVEKTAYPGVNAFPGIFEIRQATASKSQHV